MHHQIIRTGFRALVPTALFAALSVPLAGCGVARNIQANTAYDASVAAYKDCLARSGPTACESQRLIMQTDKEHAEMASLSGRGGGGGAVAPYVPPRSDPVICNTMRTGIMNTTTCN